MHSKPKDYSQTEKAGTETSQRTEVQSELIVRENTQAKSVARNIPSSNDYRGTSRKNKLINPSSDASQQLYCGEQKLADIDSSDFTASKQGGGPPARALSKPHSRTANEAIGSSVWKGCGSNNIDDQFKIRITKEGKAYTKKIRIEGAKKPVPRLAESAFTAQYNAQKNVMNSTASFISK